MVSHYVSTRRSTKEVYHTDKECSHARHELTEMTEEHVERLDLKLCNRCAGNGNDYPDEQKTAWRYRV